MHNSNFDAAVVFVTNSSLLFRLALAILLWRGEKDVFTRKPNEIYFALIYCQSFGQIKMGCFLAD
jgi:hypothetical protein